VFIIILSVQYTNSVLCIQTPPLFSLFPRLYASVFSRSASFPEPQGFCYNIISLTHLAYDHISTTSVALLLHWWQQRPLFVVGVKSRICLLSIPPNRWLSSSELNAQKCMAFYNFESLKENEDMFGTWQPSFCCSMGGDVRQAPATRLKINNSTTTNHKTIILNGNQSSQMI
jgi:hypothetical protein